MTLVCSKLDHLPVQLVTSKTNNAEVEKPSRILTTGACTIKCFGQYLVCWYVLKTFALAIFVTPTLLLTSFVITTFVLTNLF